MFALRGAARKYSTPVDALAALAQRYAADVALIDAGAGQLKVLEKAAAAADKAYDAAAQKLSAARNKSADKLNKAVNSELAPLKLDRAKFSTQRERSCIAGTGASPYRILGRPTGTARSVDESGIGRRTRASARAQGRAVDRGPRRRCVR